MTLIKAAVCREFGKPLVIEEVELLPPNYGEVQVKLGACSICHSDILYELTFPSFLILCS